MSKHLRTAWQVWRHGLPVAEVTYRRDNDGIAFTVTYAGMCHGVIDGEELWTNDGTFTVDQRLEFV